MQQNNVHILSTRPLDDRLVQLAAGKNIIIETISFIETEQIDDIAVTNAVTTFLREIHTVVFTSMVAAEIIGKQITEGSPDWKIFCIGLTTKKIVSDFFGEDRISGSADNADELAGIIIDDGNITELIFFCGDHRRNELPDKLRSNNISVKEMVVYRTLETPHKIGKDYNGIAFFSPSAVESFFKANNHNDQTIFFSIGNTTAEAIRKYSGNQIVTSKTPGKEQLVHTVIQYYKKQNDE